MFIGSLQLENFGPFDRLKVDFRQSGVNAILGPNVSGKSQIAGSIVAALVGRRALGVDSGGSGNSFIELMIAEGEQKENHLLEIQVNPTGKFVCHQRVTSSTEGQAEGVLGSMLKQGFGANDGPRSLLMRESSAQQLRPEEFSLLERAPVFERLSSFVQEELRRSADGDHRIASAGLLTLSACAKEYAARKLSGVDLPLIIDGIFDFLDEGGRSDAYELVAAIGRHCQVLLFSPEPEIPFDTILQLLPVTSRKSHVWYNYFRPPPPQQRSRRPRKEAFTLGGYVNCDEDLSNEFKEVRGENPVNSIESVVDQYVVAFLNSRSKVKGRIIWGVRDSDAKVLGVRLDRKQRDSLRRRITEKLHKITPTIAPTLYAVKIHPLGNSDLYVVEVWVPPSEEIILYSTGKQEVHVKTDSGKKKLSALEIQKELLCRCSAR